MVRFDIRRSLLGDACILGRSLFAVASSEPMPAWQAYRAAVERSRIAVDSDGNEPAAILAGMRRIACDPQSPRLSFAGDRVPSPMRLVAALASFVDDYDGPFPHELFPEREVAAMLDAIAAHERASLSIPRQLALAQALTTNAFSAFVVLHATLRLLARGRDVRAFPALPRMSLRDRLEAGASIAAFREKEAQGGDPLGDTYHYWAMVTAGAFARHVRPRAPFEGLFAIAPHLMTTVRGGLFGRTLFYGNHAIVDRLGFAHGRALANARPRSPRLVRHAAESRRCPSPPVPSVSSAARFRP